MKLITAIVQPHKITDIKNALAHVGISDIAVTEVHGYGRQNGYTDHYAGPPYYAGFLPKLRLEVVTHNHTVENVLQVITHTARTGKIGDGKIWVTPISTTTHRKEGDFIYDHVRVNADTSERKGL
ncbi:P-II family nitrogen regulator [Nocardia sp. NPDC052278]|uniref:P-II family nitrogen regulator n=1 Tax=unclassified Nocardia TaxID=2637762 RepID=UPI003691CDB4